MDLLFGHHFGVRQLDMLFFFPLKARLGKAPKLEAQNVCAPIQNYSKASKAR